MNPFSTGLLAGIFASLMFIQQDLHSIADTLKAILDKMQ